MESYSGRVCEKALLPFLEKEFTFRALPQTYAYFLFGYFDYGFVKFYGFATASWAKGSHRFFPHILKKIQVGVKTIGTPGDKKP
jgi:hypothetical protein